MIKLPIVGAKFRPPAEEVLKLLPAGTGLTLRRQPENPYDANAVAVLLYKGEYDVEVNEFLNAAELDLPLHLGFIPRADLNLPMDAARLAPILDAIFLHTAANFPNEPVKVDWPGTLSFGPTGNPMITFEEPRS